MKKSKRAIAILLVILIAMGLSTIPFSAQAAIIPIEVKPAESGNDANGNGRYDIINTRNATGWDIVNEAKKWLGKGATYWSGSSPWPDCVTKRMGFPQSDGSIHFDCSGFVSRVLNDVGLRCDEWTCNYGNTLLTQTYGNNYISTNLDYQRRYRIDIDAEVQRAKNGDWSGMQPGDIITFVSSNNHVLIYAGQNNSGQPMTIEVYGNGNNDCVRYGVLFSNYPQYFAHGARLVGESGSSGSQPDPGSAPSVAVLSTNYTSYYVDETVVFSIVADGNVNNLWIYCPNGETLTYTDVGTRYELAFGMSGHFQALVETWNGIGSKCSDLIDFYVGDPTYARICTNKTNYAVDERVYFYIEADGIKNVLWIYCPNGDTLTYDDVGTCYDLGFGMSGHFQALVQTWNGVGSRCSDRIDFFVGPQKYSVNIDANGGSASTTSMLVAYGEKCNLSSTFVSRDGYVLNGWNLYRPADQKWYVQYVGWCTEEEMTANGYLKQVYVPNLSMELDSSWLSNADSVQIDSFTFYAVWEEDAQSCAHDYVAAETTPTCTEQGYTTFTCSKCGNSYADNYIDALGHDFGTWSQTKAPTCTEKGEEKRTCSRCDVFETREVEALGHDLISHAAQAPTCTAVGWDAYDTCSRCDYSTYVEKAALGHDYQSLVTVPNCTEQGYTTHTCSRCGDNYKDTYVDALGHNFGAWTQTVAPTCTEKGEEKHTCSRCDTFETREIDALGHNYQAVVTAPTCTAGGFTTYTCPRCGDSYMADETAALGHDWSEWRPVPMNFCTDPRIEERTCNRCGATESRTLPPDGHTPGEPEKENDLAPTCEVAGGYDMVVYCTVCGAEISREHTDVAALGHDWNEPEYVWADDYSTVTATRTCANDASHVETETVNTTSEVIKEATYDEEGRDRLYGNLRE